MNQNGWVPSLERASWTAPHFTLRLIPPSGDGGYGLRPPSGDGGYGLGLRSAAKILG